MEVPFTAARPPIDAPWIGNVTQGETLGNGAHGVQAKRANAGN